MKSSYTPLPETDSDPIDALIRLINRAERLEALPRTGWLISGVSSPESVAAHTYMVTLIALWIADTLGDDCCSETVMRMALIHDIGEAIMTDLPGPVKYFVGKDVLDEAEHKAAHKILDGAPESWGAIYDRYEARDTLEARVVKAADHIQMMAKTLQYAAQGRGDTERFWRNPRNMNDFGIPIVREILDRLKQHREDGAWFSSSFD